MDGTTDFQTYKSHFVRDFSGPYIIQHPGRTWKTKEKHLADRAIRGHLDGNYWIGKRAPWYPGFVFADLDNPTDEQIQEIEDVLGLRPGQYLVSTSPSFDQDGSRHLMIRPEYNGKPGTRKLLESILRQRIENAGAEFYPRSDRGFRLPFGRDQYLIDTETGSPLPYTWEDCLYWTDKLDPLDVGSLPHNRESNIALPSCGTFSRIQEAQELWDHGLQSTNSRHDSTLAIAKMLYRKNIDIDIALDRVLNWIRTKHHGYSKEINRGYWNFVEKDTENILTWVYRDCGKRFIYPDTVTNLDGWITSQDIEYCAGVFPGKIIQQRRLFKLICYVRARGKHDWVYIPRWQWFKIAGKTSYKRFQAELYDRGLMMTDGSYTRGIKSKSYRIALPAGSDWQKIEEDGRAVNDFGRACVLNYGTRLNARSAMGWPKQTAHNVFSSMGSTK